MLNVLISETEAKVRGNGVNGSKKMLTTNHSRFQNCYNCMKIMKKPTLPSKSGLYDPAFDKWDNVDLFPEKTAKARAMLEKYPVPGHLLKRPSK